MSTVSLGVGNFSNSHTSENIAEVKSALMEEWGIQNKVRCLVTDGAANIIASQPGCEEGNRTNTRIGGHMTKGTKDFGSFQIQHNSKRKIIGVTKSDGQT